MLKTGGECQVLRTDSFHTFRTCLNVRKRIRYWWEYIAYPAGFLLVGTVVDFDWSVVVKERAIVLLETGSGLVKDRSRREAAVVVDR